eukprot:9821356-Karenia_brevis.AAC.1
MARDFWSSLWHFRCISEGVPLAPLVHIRKRGFHDNSQRLTAGTHQNPATKQPKTDLGRTRNAKEG